MESKKKKSITIKELVADVNHVDINLGTTMSMYTSGDASIYFDNIREALKIISQYNDGQRIYEPASVTEDLLKLSAIHTNLSEVVGYFQGMSSKAEHTRRVTKSDYAIQLRQLRDKAAEEGTNISITQDLVDDLSRTLSKDAYKQAGDMEIISRMLTSAWHAINDFTSVLNSVCYRASKEQDNQR